MRTPKIYLAVLIFGMVALSGCSIFKNTSSSKESKSTFEGMVNYSVNVEGGAMAKQLSGMMPSKISYGFSGQDMMVKIEGGMAASQMGDIVIKDNGSDIYMVKHGEKKVIKLLPEDQASSDSDVKKTKETAEIQGYKCKKYSVTKTEGKQNVKQHFWTTTELNTADFSAVPENVPFAQSAPDEVKGFPLKIESELKVRGQELKIIFLANEIQKEKPEASKFNIPEDYEMKEKKSSEVFSNQ
jgi:hypothetical protein